MSMTTIKNNTSLEVMDKSVFANLEAISVKKSDAKILF